MKKIHLLHYLLLCYMVLAVATSCGDDEDDYAPDNVNDPEKLTDPFAYYRPVRRNTQQHALLPFVLEQRRPYDIREHDKPLQGGGSLCSGKEDGGWRRVLLYPAGH